MSVQASNFTKPVTILGAGISGLAFAQALRIYAPKVPFVIAERDSSFKQRSQGYRITLGGRAVEDVRKVLPSSLFDRLCRSCPERLHDENGVVRLAAQFNAVTGENLDAANSWKNPPSKPPVPEGTITHLSADRTVLRDVLVRGLEDQVQYGKDFDKYEVHKDGVLVHFKDGTSIESSLVVAADGARSQARRQLLGDAVQLWDTDLRTVYGRTPITQELDSQLNKEARTTGTSIIKDLQHPEHPMVLIMEPLRFMQNEYRTDLPDDYIFWALVFRQSRADVPEAEYRQMPPHKAAALVKRLTATWHPSIRPLFELQDEDSATAIRIATVKPGFPNPNYGGRVTLIGDAAHAMSPSAGAGAANAIKDGEVLARMLRERNLDSAIEGYVAEMRQYAEGSLYKGEGVGKWLFNMPSYDEMKLLEG